MNVMEEAVLLEKYRHLVRAVAWSVSPEAARDEDALQSGFIGLWDAARRWDGRRPFEPLARRCIRCNIVDYLRGREDFEGLTDDLPEDNSMAERQAEALKGSGLRVRVYHGAEDAQAWNAGQVDLLLAHPASCGYGLNLQAGGHHIVWYGYPNWALELYQQANARLRRQGQQHPVIAHHLVVQGGMDMAVVAALHDKGDTQEALMQALKARIQKAREV